MKIKSAAVKHPDGSVSTGRKHKEISGKGREGFVTTDGKLKKEYGKNKGAIYGTLNKIGLMKGNKPTEKGLKKAKRK